MIHTGLLIAAVILAIFGALVPTPYDMFNMRLLAASLALFEMASLF